MCEPADRLRAIDLRSLSTVDNRFATALACLVCCVSHPLHATPVLFGSVQCNRTEEVMPVTKLLSPADAATQALDDLVVAIDDCVEQLQAARARAGELLASRTAGTPWLDIVTAASRPLVVESVGAVRAPLARAGSTFRRERARALRAEQVSISRIAALFGVTRQRISALLRERENGNGQ